MAPSRTSTSSRGQSDGPAPTTVLLVRHGQTPTTGAVLPGRAPGLHLGDAGIAQAERAAARIAALGREAAAPDDAAKAEASKRSAKAKKKAAEPPRPRGVTAVYASPLERTQETAKPIAKATKLRVRTHAGLLECDFGAWTGRNLADLRKLPEWNAVQRYPSGFRFPRGESFAEMQTRMCGALADLVAKHPGETIVAVSHADTIKAAVAAAMGTHLDLFQRIVVSPCSITAITYTAGGPIVLAVNSTGDDLTTLVPS
ncbi:MAG: histidine phosphatase family protein [Acidimicrobiales bacterium]